MGLYLAVFNNGEELDGLEVGAYEDFEDFRNEVSTRLEGGKAGALFPTLMLHSPYDGQWAPAESAALEEELKIIQRSFEQIPPNPVPIGWKMDVANMLG